MKKIKNIVLIVILYFVLLATTNSFAAEEFTLEKEYLTLLPGIEYTLTCSDDIFNYEYTILNETSVDWSGNHIENNSWLNCNFENNLIYIEPYISSYIGDNEATIKLSITSVNNETKECIIYVPSVRKLYGVDHVLEIFNNTKIGTIIDLKPEIDVDNSNYIWYSNGTNYDNNCFFVICDIIKIEKDIMKKIDTYTFEIQEIGEVYFKSFNWERQTSTYYGSIFEFKNSEKIIVNKNEVFNIEINSDFKTWSNSPPYIRESTSYWESEDTNILHILESEKQDKFYEIYDNECEFFAKNVGTTKIIVRNSCDNTIIEKEVEVINPIKKINFDKISIELNEGETYSLVATVTPTDATYKDLTWLSSNESVAAVDENGKITAISNGLAIISAIGYGDVEERCVVKVTNPVKKITFDKKSLELKKGEIYNLTVTVTTTNESYKNLNWSTSDANIATVDENGKITAINSGLAVITAVGHGDVEEKCVVLVKDNKPNNIIITTLPVTSNIKFAKNTLFNSIATVENFPVLGYEGYGLKLYSSSGEEKANDSILGSKDIISVYDENDIITTYNVVVKGDVSGDGTVKIYDSFQILKGVLINEELDEVETEIRDYNEDGKVAIYDAFQYLKEAILE